MKFIKTVLFLFLAFVSFNFFGVAEALVGYDLYPLAPTTTTNNIYDIDIPISFTSIVTEVDGTNGYVPGVSVYYTLFFKVATGKDGSGTTTNVDVLSQFGNSTPNTQTSKPYTFTSSGIHSVQACIKDAKTPTYDFNNINTNTSNDCSAWVNLNPGVPDLQMYSSTTSDTGFGRFRSTGEKDYTIYMSTKNTGNASTKIITGVSSFTNLIQMATELDLNSNPVGAVSDYATYTVTSVPAYDSSKTGSYNFDSVLKHVTFPSNGTFYVRTCADKSSAGDVNGVIPESNEENNCNAWVRQIVEPTGTLSATKCTIASTESTCNTKAVTWTTQNLTTATTEVTRNNPNYTHVSWDTSGNITTPVTYGITKFFLYHESKQLAPKTGDQDVSIIVWCNSTNHWNGTICTPDTVPTVTITLNSVGGGSRQDYNGFETANGLGSTFDGVKTPSTTDILKQNYEPYSGGERGVVWNTTGNPTIADGKKSEGTSYVGVFGNGFYNLNDNTTYYIRTYATNSIGTGYSNQVTYKTGFSLTLSKAGTGDGSVYNYEMYAPGTTVTMEAYPNANSTFVGWSGDNPDCSDGVVTMNASTGCVATFTSTNVVTAPTVTTASPVTNITTTTAHGTGTIVSNGGAAINTSGLVWGTSINPTTADSKTTDGWASGGPWIGTSDMTGLTINTTYHVRAYATNSKGTSYGDDVTFKTLSSNSIAPDLQVSSSNVKRITSIVDTNTTFISTIKNVSTTTSTNYKGVNTFTNLFQTARSFNASGNPINPVDYPVSGMVTLAAQAEADTTKIIKFTSIGKYYVRTCADKNGAAGLGTIDEGTAENENNNCSEWIAITVAAAGGSTNCVIVNAENYGLPLPCFYDETFCKIPTDPNYGKASCALPIPSGDLCGGNGADNSPTCTTKNGVCINGGDNPATCTTINNLCINGATNPPTCTGKSVPAVDLCPDQLGDQPTLPCSNGDWCPAEAGIQLTLPCSDGDMCPSNPGIQKTMPCPSSCGNNTNYKEN